MQRPTASCSRIWRSAGVGPTGGLPNCPLVVTGGSIGPSAGYDPRFGPPPGPSQSDLMMQESQAVGLCMRDKGYALVEDK